MALTQTAWTVDLPRSTATHRSGMTLSFEGIPDSTNFSVSPGHVPPSLKAVQVVSLIREGVEAFKSEYQETYGGASAPATETASPRRPPVVKVLRRRSRSVTPDRS